MRNKVPFPPGFPVCLSPQVIPVNSFFYISPEKLFIYHNLQHPRKNSMHFFACLFIYLSISPLLFIQMRDDLAYVILTYLIIHPRHLSISLPVAFHHSLQPPHNNIGHLKVCFPDIILGHKMCESRVPQVEEMGLHQPGLVRTESNPIHWRKKGIHFFVL